jgi:pilus assembly protein CpaB
MSPVRLIILLVAAGAAIAAVFMVRAMQTPSSAVAAAPPPVVEMPKTEILVARQNIPVGKFLTVEDLRWQPWPQDSATENFTDKKINPQGLESAVGSVALANMVEGEPLTAAKYARPGTQGFMSVMLTPGMRAISIDINSVTGAGGFILPNDRVDVLITRDMKVGDGAAIDSFRTEKILSNVRVLAIDAIYGVAQEGQGAAIVGSRATIELGEKDAMMLRTAQRAGSISLVLRSIANLTEPSGATGIGKVMRDGARAQDDLIRVYRGGAETVASVATR